MPWRWWFMIWLYEFSETIRDARTWMCALTCVVGVCAVVLT
jgi:hypothetical protein